MPIVYIALGSVALTAGDIVYRYYWSPQEHFWWVYMCGLALYLVGLMFLVESYKYENIAVASTALVVLNIVCLAVVSWFLFDQKFSLAQLLGIALAIAAIIILELAS